MPCGQRHVSARWSALWQAAQATAATSYGASCELGIGTPATLRYRIDPSACRMPTKNRLTKQRAAKGTSCAATVTGTEVKNLVKAPSIRFCN